MKLPKESIAIGLKSATHEEIEALHVKYPNGVHKQHFLDGRKLPYNGVFYPHGKGKISLHRKDKLPRLPSTT